eukprot:scaffold91375_cov60-Phaeocystis_antarctica.AAC.1
MATLWLAQHLLLERLYLECEMDWIIATRFSRKQVPDCPTIRKEFERYGLLERAPGGGGFRVLPAALEAALAKLEPAGAAKPPKKTPNRNW